MAVISSRLARRPVPTPPVAVRKALVAAASQIPLDGSSWKNFKLGDTAWQTEGWNHYDICGELRFVANWIGSSVSRCRIYIAKVDDTGKPGEEVTEPELAVLAETVFGGPAKKAEAMRLLGTHLYVPGESYIVAEGVENANEDRWYVVSTSGIKRQGDREISVERPQEYGGGWYTLKEGRDLLIRAWTPHPRKPDLADSSVRPALPILREIEQLTKHIFAQIDSRLAGAGLLLLPDQLDFPRGDDDPAGAEGLMKVLQRAMAAALADRADPSSLVPIMAQVPGEFIDKVRHITFETPLAAQGMEIRDRAIRRLGLSLDVDPEILLGKGDTNHWSAWQLEETTIKVHIEPILARICDALTTGYLRAALIAMGKDPDEYTYWYDPSPLAVRPDRQTDAVELHDKDALSDEALRAAGSWSEDDAPDDEERARRLATKLVLASPELIREKAIRDALGVKWEIEAPQPPPAVEPGAQPGQEDQGAPKGKPEPRALPEQPKGQQSAAQAALLMGAHMVVQRSLEMAGKRLLTRANRDKYREVPPWELHTVIHVLEPDHAERLLDDTFATVPMLADRTGVPAGELREALAAYCKELFVRAVPHDIDTLEEYLGWCMESSRDEMSAWLERQGQFHLPGLHDQKDHGRKRKGLPGLPKQREPEKPAESPGITKLRADLAAKQAEAKQAEGRAAEILANLAPEGSEERAGQLDELWAERHKMWNANAAAGGLADALAKELEKASSLTPEVQDEKTAAEREFLDRMGDARRGRMVIATAQVKLDDLSPSDPTAKALETYKGNDFDYINRLLRDTKGDEGALARTTSSGRDYEREINAIDNAMHDSRLGRDSELWRGMLFPQGVFGAGWNDDDVSGLEWTDHAFVSTSAREGGARDFAQAWSGYAEGAKDRVVMRMLTPAGVGAVNISGFDGEGEMLLERGLRYRVVRDNGVVNNVRQLDVEVVR